jgi:hypothetical protein
MKLIKRLIEVILTELVGHPEEEGPGKTVDYGPLVIVSLLVITFALHVYVMLTHPVALPITYMIIVALIGRKAFLERQTSYHVRESYEIHH